MANLIRFLFHTGLRLSEVFAISWEDYNEKEAELSINKSVVSGEYKQTKTSLSTRTIILSDFATKILKKQKKLTAGLEPETIQVIRYGELLTENVRFIFRSDTTGKPYLANHSYRKQWNKILNHPDKKGPNKSLMDLRHSYATNEIIAGTELMFLAQMLGHSTINTMYKHYAKIINQRNAVNKNPINRGVISAGNIERSNK
jgi:integrase